MREERSHSLVARRCGVAAAAGVVEGMGLAEARALLGGRPFTAAPLDERRDLVALKALATWAHRFAPLVALDPPDGLLLDVTGCAPLFHGEDRLLDGLAAGVERMRVAARAAIAATAGCAWAVARHGPRARDVVAAGGEAAALERLPVAALRVPQEAVEILDEVGVERVGALARLPRGEIAARLRDVVLRRLDQAIGTAEEVLLPHRARVMPRVERAFPGPVRSLKGVMEATKRLVGELAAMLEAKGIGALAIVVTLDRSDAPPVRVARALSRRSADARHLWSLLAPAMESCNLGYGVDRVEVAAPRTGARRPQPARAWHERPDEDGEATGESGSGRRDGPDADRAVAELVDALAGRLGSSRIVRIEPVASHVPESAFRQVAVVGAADGERTIAAVVSAHDVTTAERPSILFARPEPADAATSPEADGDAPPSRLRWRGDEHEVVLARGPERIAPRWWEHAAPSQPFPPGERAYFVLTTRAGRRLWAFRETANGRWFVHGEWA